MKPQTYRIFSLNWVLRAGVGVLVEGTEHACKPLLCGNTVALHDLLVHPSHLQIPGRPFGSTAGEGRQEINRRAVRTAVDVIL